jgi:hypothetical protein
MSEFKREVWFSPAFDKRHVEPSKNYGVHGVDCTFCVSKDGKGVTFILFTNWMLPNVQAETDARDPGHGHTRYMFHKPQPAGVDYHDNKPQYEGQHCRDECKVTGGACYSDGSGLLADEYYETLLREGSEGVFKRLEAQYETWLGGESA